MSARPEIRLLESRVIDQIAAGEVIERPGSVVKELVENALDARAGRIGVELEDGGRDRIRVEDDGHGMSESEALLAIERHATSKIRVVEDLDGVRSLGFRGEALPSIAAVSRFQLVTRSADREAGTRIRLDAGTLTDVRPVGAPIGTVIDVRDLFHTLPARRAFLRSAATEAGHALEAVRRVAFVRPDVAFEVRSGGRAAWVAPRAAGLRERALALLGSEVEGLVPLEAEGPAGHLLGWWVPEVYRASVADGILAYVHGRWVRDRVLRNAVTAALRERTPTGRSPLLLLDLRPPPGGVDVNVHPAKAEVRFRDPGGVAAFVHDAVARAAGRPRTRAAPPVGEGLFAPARVPALPPGVPERVPAAPSSPLPDLAGEPGAGGAVPAPSPAPAPAPPGPSGAPVQARLLGVVRGRWAVLDDGAGVVVADAGRWWRRRQALRAEPGPRLVVPARVRLPARDVAVAEAAADALERLGLRLAVLTPAEVVVRGVPPSLADADPGALLQIALAAVRRGVDPRAAWGEELPAAPVTAALLADADLARLPVAGRVELP